MSGRECVRERREENRQRRFDRFFGRIRQRYLPKLVFELEACWTNNRAVYNDCEANLESNLSTQRPS